MSRPAQSPTPSAVQALAACATAPGRWGGGGAGGVPSLGHDPSKQGHPAGLGLCGDECAPHAVCDAVDTATPHWFWQGRECGAAGGQFVLQGAWVILVGTDRQWPAACPVCLQSG